MASRSNRRYLWRNYKRAFRRALEVGKRIRTETHLTKQAPSIARSVIEMAEENLKGLENKNILILGAGEMGEGMANALSKVDTGKIAFSNRNFEKAEKIAKNFSGEAIEINQIPSSLKNLIASFRVQPQQIFFFLRTTYHSTSINHY